MKTLRVLQGKQKKIGGIQHVFVRRVRRNSWVHKYYEELIELISGRVAIHDKDGKFLAAESAKLITLWAPKAIANIRELAKLQRKTA
ncbi:MAG: hypothetical protein WC415_04610 [Patescibacteria group bacterium]|jgi:hypothetical protein